ncbi:hypothetical protein L6164_004730 [Bauhinia variegata]|uniref:Uncharacterized protein n=1 Tax=Bauhinia variegata TaxID=167791 RepID=A0ACB9PNZ8_BAUVA|nr:hypothetical protein L6164_004730 [Bauhinia variegata]
MLSELMNFLRACFRPNSDRYARSGSDAGGKQDGLLWYKDSGQHLNGDFSMAVVQANNLLEDQSQIESGSLSSNESGPFGTFVGVYDGHGGPETSRFINNHLFHHLQRFTAEQKSMSMDVIRKAYQATEEGFMSLVASQWPMNPQIAAVGSCCLVGVICNGTLYVANLGDSRAVLGRLVKATGEVLAIQLSSEHNVAIESVRQELHSLHPDDSHIVVLKHNVWRVKGLIQISRSIGDVYLKKAEFNREPLFGKFRLREPFKRPILSSEPSISVHQLQPEHQFIIFASDGLWEHLSNQDAVDIVQNNPRSGSARRLVKSALQEAAKKREMRYSDLKKIDRGVRRHFHDDITVIVVFLDSNLVSRASSGKFTSISVRGGGINLPHNTLAPCTTPTETAGLICQRTQCRSKESACQNTHYELQLDGIPKLNLASFVTTAMEEECNKLIMESINKNYVVMDEYPVATELHNRCVNMIGRLFNAPIGENEDAIGVVTVGSSEAIMLAGLALKKRWQNKRKAQGKPFHKLNVGTSANVQVCWEKFARCFEVELKEVKVRQGYYKRTSKLDGIHLFMLMQPVVALLPGPFLYAELEWDFRLLLVKSINVSGHKTCFPYNYLGTDQPTFTLNFSKGSSLTIAQYYQLICLGKEGYRSVMEKCRDNAMVLKEGLEKIGCFNILSKDNGVPVVAFSLKDEYELSEKLRRYGWIVPA